MSDPPTSSTAQFTPLQGHCYCHATTYSILKPPIFINCCHCRNCQTASGSAFAVNGIIETSAISVSSSSPEPKVSGIPGLVTCAYCQTVLWTHGPQWGKPIAFLRMGTLEKGNELNPDAHFFVRSKYPWVQLPDGVRWFETALGFKGDEKGEGKGESEFGKGLPLMSEEAQKRIEEACKEER